MRLPTLLLDPNAESAKALADQLRHAGFAITVASCTADARKQLKGDMFASIVVSVDLNNSVSRECLKAMRRSAPRSWLIVLTHNSLPDSLNVARQPGADALLESPFPVAELARRLAAFSVRGRPTLPAQRLAARARYSAPILTNLNAWLEGSAKAVLPQSALGKAVHYALSQ